MVIHEEGEIVEGNCECIAGKGTKAVCNMSQQLLILYLILRNTKSGTLNLHVRQTGKCGTCQKRVKWMCLQKNLRI